MQSKANNTHAHFAGESTVADNWAEAAALTSTGLRRIVYVVSQFPSWSETFIVREIHALIDEGVDVRILSLKRSNESMVQADAEALMDRVRQPPTPAMTLKLALIAAARHPIRTLGVLFALLMDTWRTPRVLLMSLATLARSLCQVQWLERFDPQFIHAHWSTYPTTAAWALGRILHRPFGFTCHAHDVFRNHQLLPRKIREAALAVTISRHNVDWLGKHISPLAPAKLKVVHCGVDLRQISWHPEGRSVDRILAVGRLSPEKGFHTLIEACARLRDAGRSFRCQIVGEGPARPDLQSLIDGLGLQAHVELAGARPQEYVRDHLRTATVFVLPCQIAANGSRDGIPVALMEAMAAGCPVVSCPVSGVPELIADGVHGLLAPEQDADALAQVLGRLIDNPALRGHLAAAARGRIENEFDARKEASKLHGLMQEAVRHVS